MCCCSDSYRDQCDDEEVHLIREITAKFSCMAREKCEQELQGLTERHREKERASWSFRNKRDTEYRSLREKFAEWIVNKFIEETNEQG